MTTRVFQDGHETVHWSKDPMTGQVTVKRTGRAGAILKDNAAMRDTPQTGDFRKLASIPLHVFEEHLRKRGLGWRDYYQRMNNAERAKMRAEIYCDSDFSRLRTYAVSTRIQGLDAAILGGRDRDWET